jgi:hypothetical protein
MLAAAPGATGHVASDPLLLRCRICRRAFEFDRGESATVVRQVTYAVVRAAWEDISVVDEGYFLYLEQVECGAYDFVHSGACLVASSTWQYPQLGRYSAFGRDFERLRILGASPAAEPLFCWVVVQHQDGSQRIEGIVRRADGIDFIGADGEREPEGEPTELRVLALGTIRPKHD